MGDTEKPTGGTESDEKAAPETEEEIISTEDEEKPAPEAGGEEEKATEEDEVSETPEEEEVGAEFEVAAKDEGTGLEDESEAGGEEEKAAEEAESEEAKADELKTDATLSELYNRDPDLKEFIKAHPNLRGPWMIAAEINKTFRTPADAASAKENSDQLMTYDGHFFSRETGSKRAFLNALYASQVDEQGQSSGHYEEMAYEMMGEGLTNLSSSIRNQAPDTIESIAAFGWTPQQMLDVIGVIGSMFGHEPSKFGIEGAAAVAAGSPAAAAKPDAATQKILREVEELRGQVKTQESKEEGLFFDGINSSLQISVNSIVSKQLVKVTGLEKQPPAYRSWIEAKISAKINDGLRGDDYFKKSIDQIVLKSGKRDPELAKTILGRLEQRARQLLPNAFREVMKDSGAKAIGTGKGKPGTKAGSGKLAGGSPGGTRGSKSGGRSSGPDKTDVDDPKPGESYSDHADRILAE